VWRTPWRPRHEPRACRSSSSRSVSRCRGKAPKGKEREREKGEWQRGRKKEEGERGKEIGATPDKRILTLSREAPCAGAAQGKERETG